MKTNAMPIQMVDTVGQYKKIQAEIDQAVLEVIGSGAYINGPWVGKFRENLSKYLGANHVVLCGNGTDALQIALMALDLKPGDEVITSSFTFVATVEVIALLGLKPVFVDVDPSTYNIDPAKIEAKIGPQTRVILPVHLYGQPADMEAILSIAGKHNLFVIEDNAQAIGAKYTFKNGETQSAGTLGDIGTTSFYPSKNLGAFGDGGAIMVQKAALAKKISVICNHGSQERYYHELVGVNSRLDSIQAAILDIKLRYLDAFNAARQQVASWYDEIFSQDQRLMIPGRNPQSTHVFHQYTLRIKEGREKRDKIRELLSGRSIPAMIYYPVPLHRQDAYKRYWVDPTSLPVTEQLTAEVISLPIHTEMDKAQIEYIAGNFLDCLSQEN